MRTVILMLALLAPQAASAAGRPVDLSRPVEAGGAVRIDLLYGRVKVVAGNPGRVRVSGAIGEKLKRVTLGSAAGAVEVRVRLPLMTRLQSLWDEEPRYQADLLVEVPADTRLFVVSRDARVEIDGITGPIGIGVVTSEVVVSGAPSRLDVETVSGSLDFRGATALLTASTMSGSLSARGATAEADLEAVTGSLQVTEAAGARRVSLRTVSGDVEFDGPLAADGVAEIFTESGDVVLHCCAEGLALDLDTRQGDIVNEATTVEPIRDDRGHRVLATGVGARGGRTKVRSRSGLIRLVTGAPESRSL